MIMYSPIQKQQYKSRRLLTEQLELTISSYETVIVALESKSPNKFLIKVFANEKTFEETFFAIKEHILRCFIQAPLGKDLRRNIAYFQILSSLKTINRFPVQLSHYIHKTYNDKLSNEWIKNALAIITKKLKKLVYILTDEDVDLIKELINSEADVNVLFEDAVQNIVNNKSENVKKTQDIREREIDFLLIAKNFERTGDKIRDIASQVYFISTGEEYHI